MGCAGCAWADLELEELPVDLARNRERALPGPGAIQGREGGKKEFIFSLFSINTNSHYF